MAFRNIEVLLSANATSLSAQLAAAARELDAFGRKIEAGNAATGASSKVLMAGIAAGGVTVAAALAYSVKAAADFETQMRNVNSISGLSEQSLHALGAQVLDLSRHLPQSATDLAKGLYDIASSGFQGADGVTVLSNAAKAASAGLSDTATSAKAITAVLNSYGLGADKAQSVSDSLFQTVNLGVVSFSELANTIGDVIGFAAQAGVSIDQVGAAIASMTLAGLNGAEATTSLNRLIQGLIKPNAALGLVYKQLGIHITEDLKNPSIGLHGVLEQLRVATGGSIESTLALFNDIRASKGFLAATANEGANYTRVLAGMAAAHTGAGATAVALHEQMKALGAQWTIFRNQTNAAAIELGTRLIPAVTATLDAVRSLASSAFPSLQHAMAALAPFFANVVQIGGNLVDVAKTLVEDLTPVGKVLAGLVAGAVITGLNAISTVLASITGFLAHNTGLVTALAVAYGIKLAVAVASAVLWFGRLGVVLATDALDKVAIGAFNAAGSIGTMTGALVDLATVGVLAGMAAAFSNANKRAQELVATVTNGVDRTSFAGLSAGVADLEALRQKQIATGDSSSSFGNALRGAVEVFTPMKNKVADTQKAVDELNRSIGKLQEQAGNQIKNVTDVLVKLKIPDGTTGSWEKLRPQIEETAKKLGVDLTQGGKSGQLAVTKVVGALAQMQQQAGVSSAALVNGSQIDIAKLGEMAKAVDDVAAKVGDAFSSSTDFIAAFKPDIAATTTKAAADAKEQLTAAKQALDDLTAKSGTKTRQDVSDQQALRNARQRVTDSAKKGAVEQAAATQSLADLEARQSAGVSSAAADARALAEARKRVADATVALHDAESKVTTTGSQIETFYKTQIALTSQFATDLTTAAQKGLDPDVLKRLLTAGPEKAAPILQAILSDHSGKLLAMVNESESKLREISARVVEFARLTQKAINNSTDQLSKDLGTAMAVDTANMAQGAKATAESIAAAIGVPTAEVLRVAGEYGIIVAQKVSDGFTTTLGASIKTDWASVMGALAPGVQAILTPTAPTASASILPGPTTALPPAPPHRIPVHHAGGFITGAPGADVPMIAQSGEFILRASAARAIGPSTLHALNRYHEGGYVGQPMPSVSVRGVGAGSAGPIVAKLDQLLAAIGAMPRGPVDATQHNEFHGGERPTLAQLEYANRQQQWAIAGAVSR
jgi:TP901 family phage tail tape measure protein